MKQLSYSDARDKIKPGDVISFGGTGFISNAIKVICGHPVSHVGVVLQTNIPTIENVMINQIIESTSLGDGFAGVTVNRLSVRISSYNGNVWWLPLKKEFDQGMFFGFMLDQVGKKYDAPQAIGSAIDFIPDQMEDLDRLFCSELIAAGFEKVGILKNINASEMTPADICRLNLYGNISQLKGDFKEI